MTISTRLKAILSTFFITIVFILFRGDVFDLAKITNNDFGEAIAKSLLIAAMVYVCTSWVVSFRLKGVRFITVSFFPSFLIFIYSLFVELSLYQIFGLKTALFSFILSIIQVFLVYFSILNANILNISRLQVIPLEKAARTVQYIFSLLLCYLFCIIVFSIKLDFIYKVLLFALTLFYLSFQTFWVISISNGRNLKLSLTLAIFFSLIVLSLIIWPVSAEFISLVITACFYMCLGLGLEQHGSIERSLWFEYLFVILAAVFFLVVSAEWGINGRIIKIF